VQKFGSNQPLNISWYVGAVDPTDFQQTLDRFLGFSNFLSAKTGNLVILNPFKTDKEATIEALTGKYDVVYTSTVMMNQLIKAGWKPLLSRSESVDEVILSLASNKNFNSEKDFKKGTITTTYGSSIARAVSYGLINKGFADDSPLDKNKNIHPEKLGQVQLVNILINKKTDGIMLRDSGAKKLMDESPGLYKIVYKAPAVLGHSIAVSPRLDPAKVEILRAAFKALDTLDHKNPILRSMDGLGEVEHVFQPVPQDQLDYSIGLSKLNPEFTITDADLKKNSF
jgi:ABC-type phosphate/phosphonate transport system substrate-binding protein